MRKHSTSLAGYGAIFASAVLFGTYGVWAHLMGNSFGSFYQAWVRSLLIVLIMLPILVMTKGFRKVKREDWPAVGLYVTFCVFTQVPLYYAFNHAPIGAVQLIFYSVFVIAAYLVGKIYLGETITKVKLLAMVLALIGLAIVFGASIFVFAPLGLLLAAFNGIASGGEVSSTKKVSEKYPPLFLSFLGWSATFVTHLPISLLIGEKQIAPNFDGAWLWLLLYGVSGMLAFWLVIEGYRHVDASIGSLLGLSEIIFAVIFGAIVFHQALTWAVATGGVIILLAGILPDLSELYQKSRGKSARSTEPIREL